MIKKSKNLELVLVTGGAGFIGGHLVDALLQDGYRVRVLDNLAPPVHDGRLPSWFNKKAQFVKGDVCSKTDLIKALKDVSCVFHLAAYMDFHPDFSTFINTNVTSTALLYEVIREKKYPVKKIIVTSSQSVYGEGKYLCKKHGIIYPQSRCEVDLQRGSWEVRCPQDGALMKYLSEQESDRVFPLNLYGVSKKSLEDVALDLGRLNNIPSVALRYTIVHGPRQTFRHFYSGALRQFAAMALSGEPIRMHEDGQQTRDFVHIEDLIKAHLVVLKDKLADFQIFNIGSGRADKVFDLAKMVAEILNTPFRYELAGIYRVGTARHSVADIGKMKKLGWRPRRALEDNVRDYLAWIKKFPAALKNLSTALKDLEKLGFVKKSFGGR